MKSTKQQYLSKSKVSKLQPNTWVEIVSASDSINELNSPRTICLLISKAKPHGLWYNCYFPTLGVVKVVLLDRIAKIHGALDYPKPEEPVAGKPRPKIGDDVIGQLKLSKWLPVIPFTAKIQMLESDVVYANFVLPQERVRQVLSPEAAVEFTKYIFKITPYDDEIEFVSDGKWSCGELTSFQIEKESKRVA